MKASIAIGCVAENSSKYLEQALRLLQSWRWFGGSLANASFHICVVENISSEFRKKFEQYGANVHLVERYSKYHPQSNKLRFLELSQIASAERVVLLDCDTVIVEEPSHLFGSDDFLAKIADFPTVTQKVFETLFHAFNIAIPAMTERCTVHGELTIPYFNAGVLSFSRRAMDNLVPEWIRLNRALVERLDLLEDCSSFCEQASLSLALASCGIKFGTLDNRYNFPGHCLDELVGSEFFDTDPVIIHYHWRVDEIGYLLASPYPYVNAKITNFNTRLRSERRLQFNVKAFFERRYVIDPELGSWIGSRGALINYKQALLNSIFIERDPSTILDIGCGDMAVSAALPDHGYVGIDLSPTVIKANSATFPLRKFICGDFISLNLEPHELVLCLDVLIHIPQSDDYHEFVRKIVRTASSVGVIAAYNEPPSKPSEITFYHEPISKTLKEVGVLDVHQIGAYNQVSVFQFTKDNAASRKHERLEKPVFLVGSMRSGTTLLAEMLDTSPHIAYCPFELKDVWSHSGGIPMASPKTRDNECPECHANDATQKMRESLIRRFVERMSTLHGKFEDAVFLNKNPHLCNKLELVMELFPDARIIWINRHLPQVVASLKKLFIDVYQRQKTKHWWPMLRDDVRNRCWSSSHFDEVLTNVPLERIFPGGDIYYLAEYWLESNRAASEFHSGIFRTRCLKVSEDWLISAPEAQLARISGFLQLPYMKFENPMLDKKRNEIWKESFDERECDSLLRFIYQRKDEIDSIFPGEGRARLYLEQMMDISVGSK